MGIFRNRGDSRKQPTADDYVELDDYVQAESTMPSSPAAGMRVRIADIRGQQDVIEIKDAVYDGNIVVADITRLRSNDASVEQVTDQLRQTAKEIDGDIVQKGDDQIIITPSEAEISRDKL